MKIHICDVCMHEAKKASYGHWTVSLKNKIEKISLDVCEDHKDFMKGKTVEQVREWYNKQLIGPQPTYASLFK